MVMKSTKEFLSPNRKLVNEVSDWLLGTEPYAGRVRFSVGNVPSLSHLLLIVPTAQSGRNLRLTLAQSAAERGWGGVLPPRVCMPDLLLRPQNKIVATEAEELAALVEILEHTDLSSFAALFPHPPEEKSLDWALDAARTILGIYSVLGEKGLLMREVVAPEDAPRWQELARLEAVYLKLFEDRGILPRCLARRMAAAEGCLEPGIEEIILPASIDIPPVFANYLAHSQCKVTFLVQAEEAEADKFDEWGHPLADFTAALSPAALKPSPSPLEEADAIATYFAAVSKTEALPALVVCDPSLHTALEGAFQNRFADDELVLRNPTREPLAQSALGRLLMGILQLSTRGDYETFSAFIRTGDVARWAAKTLEIPAEEVAAAVGALDAVQNEHLPRTLAEVIRSVQDEATIAHHDSERGTLARLLQIVRLIDEKRANPYAFLREIFASLVLDEKNPADRELVAAAEAVRTLQEECVSEFIPEVLRQPLFLRLLKRATYMQEPTAANILAVNGWLEAMWCPEEEVVFAGFNEGCVPGDIVGDAFIPDSLRQTLGLTTNSTRTLRDKYIFAQVLRCRPQGAVSIHLHQLGADTSVIKPSRLIFPCISDADLPALARRLYAVAQGSADSPTRSLPDAWRLNLPFPPKGEVFRENISPTLIDGYLRCPFEFYLKELFGEPADDQNRELDARAFGTLCHTALESFAKSPLINSTKPKEIAAFLKEEVRRILTSFGSPLPAIIELQGEAAIARLEYFAERQAEWRAKGWQIVSAERLLSCTFKDCPTRVRGRIDRIDKNEKTGELAIIDYKTWRRNEESKRNSLQLPIYRALVEASGLYSKDIAHNSRALYCILAECAEDTLFDEEHAFHSGGQPDAEVALVDILTRIARGIFYPPNPKNVWKDLYGSLIWKSPEEGINPAWLADQKQRLEAYTK